MSILQRSRELHHDRAALGGECCRQGWCTSRSSRGRLLRQRAAHGDVSAAPDYAFTWDITGLETPSDEPITRTYTLVARSSDPYLDEMIQTDPVEVQIVWEEREATLKTVTEDVTRSASQMWWSSYLWHSWFGPAGRRRPVGADAWSACQEGCPEHDALPSRGHTAVGWWRNASRRPRASSLSFRGPGPEPSSV